MPPMVRLDTDPMQTPAGADGISGGSENVCIHTSIMRSGSHQSRWLPPQSRSFSECKIAVMVKQVNDL